MRQYLQLLQDILDNGNDRGSRAGGTRSLFGYQYRHNLQDGFPLLTTKKLSFHNIVIELIWFLKGDTNIKFLLENNCHIWSADAFRMFKRGKDFTEEEYNIKNFEDQILQDPKFAETFGDLGPVYGKQWRDWSSSYTDEFSAQISIDQIQGVIESIKKDPQGRRHIVTAWNPAELADMALPPCHCLFQFYVHDDRLSCHLYQRSADTFLGVPYNLASYALLTHIIAHQTGLGVGEFIHSFGDVHIYNNHRNAVAEQLSREPHQLPELHIIPKVVGIIPPIDQYLQSDFRLHGYYSHNAIKGELSVGV